MTTALEWRCGPPAGEYTMIWPSCARQHGLALLNWRVSAFLLAAGTGFKIGHQRKENLCFYLSFELRSHFTLWLHLSLSSSYLAVKTDDLCTVFTLDFMCYSDKASGAVCMSV